MIAGVVGGALAEAVVAVRMSLDGLMSGLDVAKSTVTSSISKISSLAKISPTIDTAGVETGMGKLRNVLQTGLGMAGIGLGISGMYALGKSLAFAADKVEMLKNSYATMLGGGEAGAKQADALVAKMKKFAAETPFSEEQLGGAITAFLPFSKNMDDLFDKIRSIGDAASVSAEGLQAFPRVSRAITQMFAKNKIQAEEMLQLAEAGIQPWQTLAKAMGKSTAEVQAMAQKGQLGVDAINKFVTQLGKDTAGAMEKQSKTVRGMWETIKDNVKTGAVAAFQPIYEVIKSVMGKVVAFVSSDAFKKAMDGIADKVRSVVNYMKAAFASPMGKAIIQMIMFIGKVAALKLLWAAIGSAVMAILGFISSIAAAVAPAVTAALALRKAWQMAMDSKFAAEILQKIEQIKAAVKLLGEAIFGSVKKAWDALSGFFERWLGKNSEAGSSLTNTVGEWTDKIIGFVKDAITWATALVTEYDTTWEAIKNSAVIAWLTIKEEFLKFVAGQSSKWDTIKNTIMASLSAVASFIATTFPPIWAAMVASFKAAWKSVEPTLKIIVLNVLAEAFEALGLESLASKLRARANEIKGEAEEEDAKIAKVRASIQRGRDAGLSYEDWMAEPEKRIAELESTIGRVQSETLKSVLRENIEAWKKQGQMIEGVTKGEYEGIGGASINAIKEGAAAAAAEYQRAFDEMQQASQAARESAAAGGAAGLSAEEQSRLDAARARLAEAGDRLKEAKEAADADAAYQSMIDSAKARLSGLAEALKGAGVEAESFNKEGAEGGEAAGKKGKGVEYAGITELSKKMQGMFGGAGDPALAEQKKGNTLLEQIRDKLTPFVGMAGGPLAGMFGEALAGSPLGHGIAAVGGFFQGLATAATAPPNPFTKEGAEMLDKVEAGKKTPKDKLAAMAEARAKHDEEVKKNREAAAQKLRERQAKALDDLLEETKKHKLVIPGTTA